MLEEARVLGLAWCARQRAAAAPPGKGGCCHRSTLAGGLAADQACTSLPPWLQASRMRPLCLGARAAWPKRGSMERRCPWAPSSPSSKRCGDVLGRQAALDKTGQRAHCSARIRQRA